jgi:hypothetical protein
MFPVGVKFPVAGSYSSASAKLVPLRPGGQPEHPPAINTIPLFSSVAVCHARAVVKLPVGVEIPVGMHASVRASDSEKAIPNRGFL